MPAGIGARRLTNSDVRVPQMSSSGGAIRVAGGYSAEAAGTTFVLQGNGAGGFFILTGILSSTAR